jgi:hypothetical protein
VDLDLAFQQDYSSSYRGFGPAAGPQGEVTQLLRTPQVRTVP